MIPASSHLARDLLQVLHTKADMIDDRAFGSALRFGLSKHDIHARELDQLKPAVLHKRASQGHPELTVRLHILRVEM